MIKEIFLFDRQCFTEEEAKTMTYECACDMADKPKDERTVWRYNMGCSTFEGDFNRGCITHEKYYLRIF